MLQFFFHFNFVFRYKSSFGDDYFSFWVQGCHFLVLNSQFYEDSSLVPELAKEHDKWLDSELEKSKKVRKEKEKSLV